MHRELQFVVFDQASGSERGRAHGELWRAEIHELAAIRLDACVRQGGFSCVEDVLESARLHLPALRDEAPEQYEELRGIGEGADLGLDRLIVLDHYAGLRELGPGAGEPASVPAVDPGGSTAIYTHGADGPLLGQTFDMHASAEPFVRVIAVRPPDGRGESVCLTLTGCLALGGLGRTGVAVTVNDLACTDATVGLLRSALVRRLLAAPDADAALARLRSASRGVGSHFMIADGERFYGAECSGALLVLTQKGARAAHLHTNHCFDPVLRQRERVSPRSSTFARLDMATTLYAQQRPTTFEALWALLGSHEGEPSSICAHPRGESGDPSTSVTCGRLLMRPLDGIVRVARGCSREGIERELELRGTSGAARSD